MVVKPFNKSPTLKPENLSSGADKIKTSLPLTRSDRKWDLYFLMNPINNNNNNNNVEKWIKNMFSIIYYYQLSPGRYKNIDKIEGESE